MTCVKKDSKNTMQMLESAVGSLRRQSGVVIDQENGKPLALYPAEFLSDALLSQWAPYRPKLLITGARARSLGIATHSSAVSLAAHDFSFAQIQALANPTLTGAPPIERIH